MKRVHAFTLHTSILVTVASHHIGSYTAHTGNSRSVLSGYVVLPGSPQLK